MAGIPHSTHHFVPAFLLREWHAPSTGRLTALAWKGGKLTTSPLTADGVAKELGLYSMPDLPPESRNVIESKVMQRVDDEGAQAHQHILREGVQSLSDEMARWWTRLVVSLAVRTPWSVDEHEASAPGVLLRTIMEDPREGEDPETAVKDLMKADPQLMRRMSLSAMVDSIGDGLPHRAIMGSEWATIDVQGCRLDLVIGDKPIVRTGAMDGEYIMLLPLSPSVLFAIYNTGNRLIERTRSLPPQELVRRVNVDMAAQAVEYLFATSTVHKPLAAKYLQRSSAA
jgi:Protein of unknown function (DUF4238)